MTGVDYVSDPTFEDWNARAHADLEHDEARARPPRCAALAVVAPATASEPLQDANVTLLSLKVNGKGEALFTYRRADGRLRRVLAWARSTPVRRRPTFPRCGSAGTTPAVGASTETGSTGGASRTAAGRTTARSTDARRRMQGPDGTYWTVQVATAPAAPRLRSVAPPPCELGVPRRALRRRASSARTPSQLDARRPLAGRLRPLQLPRPAGVRVRLDRKGRPKDKYGRNLYIDTLNSAYGAGWRRESGILTHKRHRDVLPQLRSPAAVRRLSQPVDAAGSAGASGIASPWAGPASPRSFRPRSQGSRSGPGPRDASSTPCSIRSWPATKSAPASGNEEAPWAIRGRTRATGGRGRLGRGEGEPGDGSRGRVRRSRQAR